VTSEPLRIIYIGGPTALIEFAGLRFLTDRTFDPSGTEYPTPAYTLQKTQSPAVALSDLGQIDAVLLSHDHHSDNLDHAGRNAVSNSPVTYTTRAGAERLGGGAVGLQPWESVELDAPDGRRIRITATPGRHGPVNGDRGPVIGFVLAELGSSGPVVYVSGDTVWYDGVEEVGRRFDVGVALLNLGAAKVSVAGPDPLTFTAAEALQLAHAWPRTRIVPLHFEGWAHFSEGQSEVRAVFGAAGLSARLAWLPYGQATIVVPEGRTD
jgi:L-ascorbate metabolism protein UlaG (beta-lactamase superfamily)